MPFKVFDVSPDIATIRMTNMIMIAMMIGRALESELAADFE